MLGIKTGIKAMDVSMGSLAGKSKGEVQLSWWTRIVVVIIEWLIGTDALRALAEKVPALKNHDAAVNVRSVENDFAKEVKVSVSGTPPASPVKPAMPGVRSGTKALEIPSANSKKADDLINRLLDTIKTSEELTPITKEVLALDPSKVLSMVQRLYYIYYGAYLQNAGKYMVITSRLNPQAEKFFVIDAAKMTEEYSNRCSSSKEKGRDNERLQRIESCLNAVKQGVEDSKSTLAASTYTDITNDIKDKLKQVIAHHQSDMRQQHKSAMPDVKSDTKASEIPSANSKKADDLINRLLDTIKACEELTPVTKEVLALDPSKVLFMVQRLYYMYYGAHLQNAGKYMVITSRLNPQAEKFFVIGATKMTEEYSNRCSSFMEKDRDNERLQRIKSCLNAVKQGVEDSKSTLAALTYTTITTDIKNKLTDVIAHHQSDMRQQHKFLESACQAMQQEMSRSR